MSPRKSKNFAGIHLSGPNAHKTSVVIMTGGVHEGNLKILQVFDKIGSIGQMFSDERIFDIVTNYQPESIFVDAPLSSPPCVACTRPSCPGVDGCEDLTVAHMQSIVAEKMKSKKRKRPINPQTQRFWDVLRWAQQETQLQEPSYSANMAPLVVRAQTLQRRLRSWKADLTLLETSVPLALKAIGQRLGLDEEVVRNYRSFGVGRKNRSLILEALYHKKCLSLHEEERLSQRAESFQAMICALMAALYDANELQPPETPFAEEQGWVYLPK